MRMKPKDFLSAIIALVKGLLKLFLVPQYISAVKKQQPTNYFLHFVRGVAARVAWFDPI